MFPHISSVGYDRAFCYYSVAPSLLISNSEAPGFDLVILLGFFGLFIAVWE